MTTTAYHAALDAQIAEKTDADVIGAYQAAMAGQPWRELSERSGNLTPTIRRCRAHRLEDVAIRRELIHRLADNSAR